MASSEGRVVRHGSASKLALSLSLAVFALACGNAQDDGKPWVGVQECRVGIPPEDTSTPEAIPQVSIPLTAVRFYQAGDAFYLQNFTVGPIAGFACESVPFQVTVRYASGNPVVFGLAGSSGMASASSNNGARPPLARPVVMEPFECRATDGRSYILSGTGAADLQSMFVDMRFSAWLPEGQATLLCTTRYLQVSATPDAGVAVPEGSELEMEPPPGDGTPPVEEGVPPDSTTNPTEVEPGAGAEMSGSD
ncbi:MAG TPA: hypothetical protein VFS67_04655 [Polyangiaceae bacterium]|nr:hypothetical protein [Polyangiaceae bacterium]